MNDGDETSPPVKKPRLKGTTELSNNMEQQQEQTTTAMQKDKLAALPDNIYFSTKTLQGIMSQPVLLNDCIARCKSIEDAVEENKKLKGKCKKLRNLAENSLANLKAMKLLKDENDANQEHAAAEVASPEPEVRERIFIPAKGQIAFYLSLHVKAIDLPDEYRLGFPPLILDGASGVGKTQQAFALLKDKKKLIYLNLLAGSTLNQQIYVEMNSSAAFQHASSLISNAMADVEQFHSQENDPFSIKALGVVTENFLKNDKLRNYKSLVMGLLHSQLTWTGGESPLGKVHIELHSEDLNLLTEKFQEVVLFVDEALPKVSSIFEEAKSQKRLRFLRNMGRLMGMRVVLAGAAATAAIMISERHVSPAVSRTEGRLRAWAEIMFLWLPIEKTELEKLLSVDLLTKIKSKNAAALQDAIGKERPLLAVLFKNILEKQSSKGREITLVDVIEAIGCELKDRKNISATKHVIWLAGPWLDGEQKMPSFSRMQAPELVRDHFFEPSMACYSKTKNPVLGPTFDKVERRSSPLRLGINTFFDTITNVSFFSIRARAQKSIAALPDVCDCGSYTSEGFDDIKFCLNNCTQQCFSREPLLATALSTISIEPAVFRKAISCWQQTFSERTVGRLSGEIHEHVLFAAIQLASHPQNFGELHDVVRFVNVLESYLIWPEKRVLGEFDLKTYMGISPPDKAPRAKTAALCWGQIDRDVKNKLSQVKMPWLVPACWREDLSQTGAFFLMDDFEVAGLVPGETNASFDAKAYICGSVRWAFEFRARSDTYSMQAAVDDLERKRKRDRDANTCHAMLVAVRANETLEIKAWQEESGMFCIIVLLGGV